jgi:uncharacterized membrane protein
LQAEREVLVFFLGSNLKAVFCSKIAAPPFGLLEMTLSEQAEGRQ